MSRPTPLPRITVIIPNLDQDLYLERAICSVLDQGYENLELIVMDGGSSDQSVEIIRTYDRDIDHWQSTWDSGPAEAVNTALTWATGQIVGVLDADDAYLPYALHEAAQTMGDFEDDALQGPASGATSTENPGADWMVGQAIRVDELDEHLGDLPADPPRTLSSFLMQDAGPLASSAVFYRTDLLKAMGGFDSQFKLAYAHEMHARLYAANLKPAVARAALTAVRDHDQSLSATHSLSCGPEFIDAAERYSTHLAPTHRYLLWRSCDEARRLYAAAEMEIHEDASRRLLWSQLLKRPHWLASSDYRRKLLQNLGRDQAATKPKTIDTDHGSTDQRRAA
ncbi:MAG: glycosyltransferase [Planctomycetota bacterium]